LPFNGPHPWRENEISDGVIDNSLSLYEFAEGTAIQTLLHALKYTKFKSIGRMFGEEIGRKISNGEIKYDYTVPVPLHRAKERERTYNQSDYICKGISEALGTKNLPRCMRRTRFTETQTQLHKSERRKNVHGAFELNQKFKETIAGKNIIVADDVITTGSTILECARVLKQNGCGKVLVASIAYATLD
jgi:ComF family protein